MYILATKTKDKDRYVEYEHFEEFGSLSELKKHIAETGAELITDSAVSGEDLDLDELNSSFHIYKQMPLDEAEAQALKQSMFDSLPKQLKDFLSQLKAVA